MIDEVSLVKHYRKPKVHGGQDTEENTVVMQKKTRDAWFHLFKDVHPELIASIINRVYLDPEYEFIVHKRSTT